MTLAKEDEEKIRKLLTPLFEGMMHALFKQKGASFNIEILADKPVQDFIEAHASVLDNSFKQVEMSDAMRRRLTRSDYIFSGMKAFHEMNQAFPSLLDENGNRKTFEQFLKDVQKIDSTYNRDYLRAEYNFVQSSATMAAKWEGFMEDGDRYYLQYRTAGDDKVRPEHAALNGVTLPIDDSFWSEYYPPNGWNCRCNVVQVRKSKQPPTPHDEAMALGEEALQRDTKGMFRFNAGKEQKTVPDYNPYTIRRCQDCDIAKGKLKLAKVFVPEHDICAACKLIRGCERKRSYYYNTDSEFGKRLLIHIYSDKIELEENIRGARALLNSFPKMEIKIAEHVFEDGVKNPEYRINGLIADRKGVESEKGVTSGFKKAINQGCKAVVIDLDMHMRNRRIRFGELAKYIYWRKADFDNGIMKECYVIYRDKAVVITNSTISDREGIKNVLKKLEP